MPTHADVTFHKAFTDNAVLQQAPARSAVFGSCMLDASTSSVSATAILVVTLEHHSGRVVQEASTLLKAGGGQLWEWKVLFPDPVADTGEEYSLHATLWRSEALRGKREGELGGATVHHIVFGDVWLCAGQSNMWLPLSHTFHRNHSIAAVQRGHLRNVRLTCGNSQPVKLSSAPQVLPNWMRAHECAAGEGFLQSCAACWYFAEDLTARFLSEGRAAPTLGLMCVASGGTTIEEWAPRKVLDKCGNTFIDGNGQAFTDRIMPLVRMSLKGWLWYQGE